jgi:hypothetical protein
MSGMVSNEFAAVLALAPKAVAQVVLEVMRETLSWYDPQGYGERREWARISSRPFVRQGIMSHSAAQRGLAQALHKGYLRRRRYERRSCEYALKWRGVSNQPGSE